MAAVDARCDVTGEVESLVNKEMKLENVGGNSRER